MNRRQTGSGYEQAAARFLEKQGYKVLEINYRNPFGEVDIVARENGYYVFTEVKYRRSSRMGWASEAVDERKQRRLQKAAMGYLYEKHLPEDTPCRFDVAAIDGDRITLIKDAF